MPKLCTEPIKVIPKNMTIQRKNNKGKIHKDISAYEELITYIEDGKMNYERLYTRKMCFSQLNVVRDRYNIKEYKATTEDVLIKELIIKEFSEEKIICPVKGNYYFDERGLSCGEHEILPEYYKDTELFK